MRAPVIPLTNRRAKSWVALSDARHDFHSHPATHETFWRRDGLATSRSYDRARRTVLPPWSERLRQDDALAEPGGFLHPGGGKNFFWGRGCDPARTAQTEHGDDVSKLCLVAAHDGGRERRVWARGAEGAEARNQAARAGGARVRAHGAIRRAPAEPAFRGTTATRRTRARARNPAALFVARRAALQS